MILTGIADPDDSKPTAVEDQPKSARWSVPPPALDERPSPTIPPTTLPPPPDSSPL
jgi:hypothetical protein